MSHHIIPTLRYKDAAKMIEWLCEVFGFTAQTVAEDGEGGIAHAQLTRTQADGTENMIMVSSVYDNEFGKLQTSPTNSDPVSQSIYIYLESVDEITALFERTQASGTTIAIALRDEDYGEAGISKGFVCRDPEGGVWSFGTFNPWD